MLKKLLKYDLKYVYKALIVFYIITLAFAIFTRIFFIFDNYIIFNIIAQICSGFTISFILNILVNNFMRSWVRFTKNIYSDESYLTHTLPVEKKKIYLSKILSSIITMFTSIIVILLTLFIAYYSSDNLNTLKHILSALSNVYNSNTLLILIQILLIFFIEMVFCIQVGYVGILLGHRSYNNRIVKSLIYGFSCYILTQVLTFIIILIMGTLNKGIMNLFIANGLIDFGIIKFIIIFATVLYGIYLYIYYIIGFKLFNKGVNIE